MRRVACWLFLTLILPTYLLAQRSTSSSSSSSNTASSGTSGYSGSSSGGSHSSGSSSSSSSGSSSDTGGSWHSSGSSGSSGGGGHSSSSSGSSASRVSSSSGSSSASLGFHASSRSDTRGSDAKSVTDRPNRGVNEPAKKPVQGLAATPGQKVGQKTEPQTKAGHGLFSFLRKNPPCRGKDCPLQPPCRGKNCKVTCPAGQVASGSSCVPVFRPYASDCATPLTRPDVVSRVRLLSPRVPGRRPGCWPHRNRRWSGCGFSAMRLAPKIH
jgi:hypothetical protein